jgi:hypothetical protein
VLKKWFATASVTITAHQQYNLLVCRLSPLSSSAGGVEELIKNYIRQSGGSMTKEKPVCPKCKTPLKDNFRIDNIFGVQVPTWYCHECGHSIDKMVVW